jgi:hypothetical protein
MEAQITVNVTLPCAASAPFWSILQEAEFTTLNYKSLSCTCTAQLRITSGRFIARETVKPRVIAYFSDCRSGMDAAE